MWNVESCFYQGLHHFVCEDYAQTWLTPSPILALSDGCSSEQNTDVGSRLLVYSSQRILQEGWSLTHQQLGDEIIHQAWYSARELGVDYGALYATLLLAYIKDGMIRVHMFGDGTIVWNGEPITVVYSDNAPCYLTYRLQSHGYLDGERRVFTAETGKDIDPENLYFEFPVEETDTLLLFSDGIDSFMNGGSIVPKEDLLPDLLAFPNRNNGFLLRRVNKMMKKYKNQFDSFGHSDDFSVAAMVRK